MDLYESAMRFHANGMYDREMDCYEVMYGEDRAKTAELLKEFDRTCSDRELLYRSHRIRARDYFDDFMLTIEWYRKSEAKFWLPRRAKLMGICECLQALEDDELDELFISQPPRTGKSTLVSMFILWVMLRKPEMSNLYCSYTDSVCGAVYDGMLEFLTDPDTYGIKEVFPECRVVSTDAKDYMINVNRKKKYATLTCRSLYGTLNGACDCNGYLVGDDLVSGIEEAMNPDRLDHTWALVENDFLSRSSSDKTKRLWIGTRWAVRDPQGRRLDLLRNEEKYKSIRWREINVPALNDEDESNFEYAMGKGFTTEHYVRVRASFERNNDMASWFAQFQGVPIERSGAVFEPDQFRYYNGVLPSGTPDRVFMAVDPAWGGGDYVAAPVCFQYGNDMYVADVVYDNGDKKVTQPLLVNAAIKYGVAAMSIEATKTTEEYAQGVNEELRARGYSVNVMTSTKSFTTGIGKQQRIFDKAPDIREHMVFLESGKRSRAYERFMENVFAFKIVQNTRHVHDDAPDSLAMAIDMATFEKRGLAQIYMRRGW